MKTRHSDSHRMAGTFWTLLLFAATFNLQAQYNYTTLSVPGAQSTYADGISGNYIVGGCEDSSDVNEGFIYNIQSGTYTTFSTPGAGTEISGISGNDALELIRGASDTEEFIYNITDGSKTAVEGPLVAYGISGNNLAGYALIGGNDQGVLYNMNGNSTVLNVPGAQFSTAYGVDGDNVVGQSGVGSFLYSDGAYTILPSLAVAVGSVEARGISGENIVGTYLNGTLYSEVAHGFLYNINTSSYTTIDVPGALNTDGAGIDGNNIVGTYEGPDGIDYGFLATPVPEPSDPMLLLAGAAAILAVRLLKMPLS